MMLTIAAVAADDVRDADAMLHVLYPGESREFDIGKASPGVTVFLARSDGTAVGLVTATFVHDGWEPCGYIDQLVVRPEYRGRGIGRRLMTEACNRLIEQNAVVIFVTTNTEPAERFYRHLGFDNTGPWLAWAPRGRTSFG
jgi:ribosomal protein S18 acetylase RimI-like enzyme